jgi:parallel beta-helix repeat protein
MKRLLSQMVAVLLLIGGLTLVLATPRAKSTVTVYIMADGSVNPSSAPIRRDGDTYTLSDDMAFMGDTNGIVIERDNITVDGAGFRLQGEGIWGTSSGIYLVGRSNVTIKNLEIEAFEYGIKINCSSHNIISGNNITENYHFGILLVGSSNTSISRNSITENSHIGVWLDGSSNNIIFRNNITDAELGVLLVRSNTNRVSSSFIARNAYHGLVLSESSNNCIDHNNFINNTRQAFSDGVNVWDDGYPSGGNYWSSYTSVDVKTGPYQNITASDGIGDTPQYTDLNNTDRYPLMAPFVTFDAGTWNETPYNVHVISNSTISGFHFNLDEGAFIKFNVASKNETTGFCRVTIPKELLWVEDNWKVCINGQEIESMLTTDENCSYLYFRYDHTAKIVRIIGTRVIPELLSVIILPIIIVLTMFAVIFSKKKPWPNRLCTTD